MAIETHQDRVEPAGTGPPLGGPGGVLRPWWLRPGAHVGVIGAVVGYILGHLLGNFLSSAYGGRAVSTPSIRSFACTPLAQDAKAVCATMWP